MTGLLVNDRDIVFPGHVLAESIEFLPGEDVIREKEQLISTKIGIVSINGRFVKLVPLVGPYIPKRDDIVIGKVVGIGMNGWRLDIGWAFEANLNLKDATSDFIEKGADLTKYFDYGDYLMLGISNVISTRIIDLTMKAPGLKKLGEGQIIKVGSTKVPRIIGKQGSMITMIKDYTGCRISVGQNGVVWINGDSPEKEYLAIRSIRKIEAESHITGLTDRMKEFLEQEKK
ncbi:MAG: exosome complex RNA-binding protein Rrp4 [Nanoarchaeota archaeon]